MFIPTASTDVERGRKNWRKEEIQGKLEGAKNREGKCKIKH
jgi:hypothetical protein